LFDENIRILKFTEAPADVEANLAIDAGKIVCSCLVTRKQNGDMV
jgi:hypothetical protein